MRLRAGTLYAALDRPRLDGLIGVDREEVVEGRLRRYYRLTPEGSRFLATVQAAQRATWRPPRSRPALVSRSPAHPWHHTPHLPTAAPTIAHSISHQHPTESSRALYQRVSGANHLPRFLTASTRGCTYATVTR